MPYLFSKIEFKLPWFFPVKSAGGQFLGGPSVEGRVDAWRQILFVFFFFCGAGRLLDSACVYSQPILIMQRRERKRAMAPKCRVDLDLALFNGRTAMDGAASRAKHSAGLFMSRKMGKKNCTQTVAYRAGAERLFSLTTSWYSTLWASSPLWPHCPLQSKVTGRSESCLQSLVTSVAQMRPLQEGRRQRKELLADADHRSCFLFFDFKTEPQTSLYLHTQVRKSAIYATLSLDNIHCI